MRDRARRGRRVSKTIIVYCEGESEEHYICGLRSWLKACDNDMQIKIKSECANGGGYESILKLLREEPDSNCIARIAIFDLDRYVNHKDEQRAFCNMLSISRASINNRVPCILVCSNPDFEYCVCCHDPKYKDGNTDNFIMRKMGYKSLNECKADKNIWKKLHRGERSHEIAIEHLNHRPKVIDNDLSFKMNMFSVRLRSVVFNEEKLSTWGSNLADLFMVLGCAV